MAHGDAAGAAAVAVARAGWRRVRRLGVHIVRPGMTVMVVRPGVGVMRTRLAGVPGKRGLMVTRRCMHGHGRRIRGDRDPRQ
jgi:hypothetical protein